MILRRSEGESKRVAAWRSKVSPLGVDVSGHLRRKTTIWHPL